MSNPVSTHPTLSGCPKPPPCTPATNHPPEDLLGHSGGSRRAKRSARIPCLTMRLGTDRGQERGSGACREKRLPDRYPRGASDSEGSYQQQPPCASDQSDHMIRYQQKHKLIGTAAPPPMAKHQSAKPETVHPDHCQPEESGRGVLPGQPPEKNWQRRVQPGRVAEPAEHAAPGSRSIVLWKTEHARKPTRHATDSKCSGHRGSGTLGKGARIAPTCSGLGACS